MIDVSIIVPVYNTSKYLEKCLNSLVKQTLNNIEIIIINDGSTDNSINIINDYKKKYNNIVVISQKNKGVSSARNAGINIAKGKYIGFVDSDDYVKESMFEVLYNYSKEKYDIVVCDLLANNSHMSSGIKIDINNKNEIKKNMNYINSTLCNKIYKTSILKNNLFTENMQYEDIDFLYRLFPKINNIGVVNEELYIYNNRINSKTHSYGKEWYKLFNNLELIEEYYKKNNIYKEYEEELEYMNIKYLLGTFLKKMSKTSYKLFSSAYNYSLEYIKNKYPNYKSNKYLKKANIKNIYFKTVNIISKKILYKFLNKFMLY